GVLRWAAEVMRDDAPHFAGHALPREHQADHLVVFAEERAGKVSLEAQLKLRPELCQRERRIEVHVVGVVHEVFVAFEIREVPHLTVVLPGVGCVLAIRPDRAAVHEEVRLVEKRLLVPVRQAAVLKYRGLPVLDLHFPRRVISERITGDERRGAAITPVEAGIAAEPGAPLTEAGARHIPRQRKNYLPRLT